MAESRLRHDQAPHIYEELTLMLIDKDDNRQVRTLRYFARQDDNGSSRKLLVFDDPREIRGVALLNRSDPGTPPHNLLYLPALHKKFQPLTDGGNASLFVGSDFATEDLIAEIPADFRYERQPDQELEKVDYYVVDVFPASDRARQSSLYGRRRHYLRQDNLMIVRTDFFERGGHFLKRRTSHDLKQMTNGMWQAGSILMDNPTEKHKSLIKVDRRIFSSAYVPPEIFTTEWLEDNRHIQLAKPAIAAPILPDGLNPPPAP